GVELDAAARVFHRHDRVAQFEQVLSLHCQQLLADLLRLRLGRKGDHNEFTHGILPWQLQKSIAPRRRRDTDLWCNVTEATPRPRFGSKPERLEPSRCGPLPAEAHIVI